MKTIRSRGCRWNRRKNRVLVRAFDSSASYPASKVIKTDVLPLPRVSNSLFGYSDLQRSSALLSIARPLFSFLFNFSVAFILNGYFRELARSMEGI